MDQELINFDETFSRYGNMSDKYQSQYIFVIIGITAEVLIEKIVKMITIADNISNPARKTYIKSRLNNFTNTLTNIPDQSAKINGIYFVSDNIDYFELTGYWKNTLNIFGCSGLLSKYDDVFCIDWLKNLLLDRSYISIIHVKNTTIKHVHLGLTKRKVVKETTKKQLDLLEYINENKQQEKMTIVHGVSSALKNVNDSDTLKVFNSDKREDELMHEYDKFVNEKNGKQLEWWLDRIADPKEGRKIVFGLEIKENIECEMLKIIFCSPERAKKIMSKFSTKFPNLSDKIIIVNSYGNDIGNRLTVEFKGAIGIKFY